jgi:hypothetical protein
MEKNYLVEAIFKLRPNSEFVIHDNDYSTIEWFVLDGTAPTKAEIDAAIKQIKAQEVTEAAAKATEKTALLARLGLTADEAKLLLS